MDQVGVGDGGKAGIFPIFGELVGIRLLDVPALARSRSTLR